MKQRTQSLLAGGALLLLTLGGTPAVAGTADDPEISDIAGDANGVNGQGVLSGLEDGPVTATSVDSADLRAVWLETTYRANKVTDASGAVVRVQHAATGVRVNIRTEAPVHPASAPQMRPLYYDLLVSIPSCNVRLRLQAGSNPETDPAMLHTLDPTCPGGASSAGESTIVSYDGNVATLDYPFSVGHFGQVLKTDVTLAEPSARVVRPIPFAGASVIDEAPAGGSFTIGQDIPADIDCTVEVGNPACQP